MATNDAFPIIIVGSSNTDMVVKTKRFPHSGETFIGGDFFHFPGGKGANQAVAAARLGSHVLFVARVGNDLFGRQAIAGFIKEGIDVRHVLQDETAASGTALITVNEAGENTIVVAPGANAQLLPAQLSDVDFPSAKIVLAQLETPLETVLAVARLARGKFILNPAPARDLPEEIYQDLYAITPNETETELLTGVLPTDPASRDSAARIFHAKGVANVFITLGSKGCYYSNGRSAMLFEAPSVTAVDTTAAGDVFNGALAHALSIGKSKGVAAAFAVRAASISVTRMGAQPSAPFLRGLS